MYDSQVTQFNLRNDLSASQRDELALRSDWEQVSKDLGFVVQKFDVETL
jgi:hypothetical protein